MTDFDYEYAYNMKLSCIICTYKNPNAAFKEIMDLPTFSSWDLEEHLRTKHSIDEILKVLTDFHWQLVLPPKKK